MMVRWLMDCDALMSCGPNYQTIQTSHPFSTEFRLAGPQLLWLWLFHIHIHHSHPSTSISYPCISHSWTKPHFVMLVSSLPILPSSTRRYTDRQLGLNDLERDFIKTLCTLSHLHDNSTRLSIPNSRLTKKTHTHTQNSTVFQVLAKVTATTIVLPPLELSHEKFPETKTSQGSAPCRLRQQQGRLRSFTTGTDEDYVDPFAGHWLWRCRGGTA